ncbi:MAG: hypothetical protein OXC19_09145 [Bryobacterales bacterium]|nr:hypothetical protein [Bryobacterales bacterium]
MEQAARDGAEVSAELVQDTVFAERNADITFIWMTKLFRMILGRAVLLALFLIAFAVVALTSLIAMVELAARSLQDVAFRRERAIWWFAIEG